jgi:hypothetical protein
VTLYHSDSSTGTFTQVPNGDALMSPVNRRNPDTTDASGHFGWDVLAGYYKVRTEKVGCYMPGNPAQAYVESAVLTIPPEVTDLVLTLACPENINASLNLAGIATSYDRTPRDNAPSGVYTITATFTNISANDLTNLYFNVATLTNGNLLLNADGGPAGVGAILTAPGYVVHLGDSFQVIFLVGLQARMNFTLYVDAYGIDPETTLLAANASSAGNGFRFVTHDLGYSYFLPSIAH